MTNMKGVLSPGDIRRLEKTAAEFDPMDYCIVLLLTRTGARVSEVASLRLDSVIGTPTGTSVRFLTLKEKIVGQCTRCHTRTGRTAKFCPQCGARAVAVPRERRRERLIPIPKDVTIALHEYKQWRSQQAFAAGSSWLFPSTTKRGEHLSRMYITKYVVYPVAEAAGLGGKLVLVSTERGVAPHRVSPQRLRDALATSHLHAKGVKDSNLRELQEFLGHRTIETTAKYAKGVLYAGGPRQ